MKHDRIKGVLAEYDLHLDRVFSYSRGFMSLSAKLLDPKHGPDLLIHYEDGVFSRVTARLAGGEEDFAIVTLYDLEARNCTVALRKILTAAQRETGWEVAYRIAKCTAHRIMISPDEDAENDAIACAQEVSAVLERYGLMGTSVLSVRRQR